MSDTRNTNLDQDLADLGGDARAAADNPISADPGGRDASATGGGQGGGSEPGPVAAGGLAGSATDELSHRVAVDQRSNPTLEANAEHLEQRLGDQHNIGSELGRLGPGGEGVGNTIAPQARTPAQQD